jgi:hypothetical protein
VNRRPGPDGQCLLSLRTTVIPVAGIAVGVLIGGLTLATGADLPAAFLAGLPAVSGTVLGLHQLVEGPTGR